METNSQGEDIDLSVDLAQFASTPIDGLQGEHRGA